MNICQECDEPFSPKRNSVGMYCSRSCSVRANNRKSPKRALTQICGWNQCTTLIPRSQRRCAEHKGLREYGAKSHGLYTSDTYDITLAEAKSRLGNPSSEEFSKFLRNHARRWAATNMPHVKCHSCDYDKVTELAHIRPLKHFGDRDLIRQTFENNLVRLCPNHHWEFDHGLHSVSFIT